MRIKDIAEIFHLPSASVDLMFARTRGNEDFYARLVRNFHQEATSRHHKAPFVKKYEYGFAMCEIPGSFDAYFDRLEASARRNYHKALRLGYSMRRFDFNSHLEDVREILRSKPVRQGELPPQIREGIVHPISDPPSRTSCHDYPYFGVFKDGKLFAYAACMVAGELCNLNDIYGHAGYQSDGVGPLLIIEIARELMRSYPMVRYYSYGTYFGASDSMRRFKRKFLFLPRRVTWILDGASMPSPPSDSSSVRSGLDTTPLGRAGKLLGRLLLHNSGGLRGVRHWHRRAFRILMYHNFPDPPLETRKALARQCAHIIRHYRVVSLSDIAKSLKDGSPLPPNALAVTIDDGCQDFILNGYPVFSSHDIPVTMFLVSGFLDHKSWLWWHQIQYALRHAQCPYFQIALSPNRLPVKFPLKTDGMRRHAIDRITKSLMDLGDAERAEILAAMFRLLDASLPADPPPQMRPLDWSEVRELAKNNVEFGAHTVTHPVLSRISQAQLREEIGRSKRRIEEEIGRPVAHFSYPYGRLKDFNLEAVQMLEQCRFDTAVTAQTGFNFRDTHPFHLRRLGVDPTMPEHYFQELLAGLHHVDPNP